MTTHKHEKHGYAMQVHTVVTPTGRVFQVCVDRYFDYMSDPIPDGEGGTKLREYYRPRFTEAIGTGHVSYGPLDSSIPKNMIPHTEADLVFDPDPVSRPAHYDTVVDAIAAGLAGIAYYAEKNPR